MDVLEDMDLLHVWLAVGHDNPAEVDRRDRLMASVEGDQPFGGVIAKTRECRCEPALPVGEVPVHLRERFEHRLDPVVIRLVVVIRVL